MKNTEFDSQHVLGNKILELSRQELCEFVSRLCRQIMAESRTRTYRGGIYPENISLSPEGFLAIGQASEGNWEGQELQFLPPELYWNGKRGSFSDVYSLGLLLYYAVSKGRLPYDGQCKDPQQRRMGGENFPAPRAAGRRLGEIIEKATRFNSEERYQNVEQLQIMLDSFIKNLYLNGAPSSEAIFHKDDGELTDIERLMVDIIEKGEEEPEIEETEEPVFQLPEEPEEEPEQVRLYEPSHGRQVPPLRQPIPILTEEKNPELEPVIPGRPQAATPAVQYGKSAQRERKIAEQARKRRRKPAVFLLVFCALLVVGAIILNAVLRDVVWKDDDAGKGQSNENVVFTPPTIDPSFPTPPPSYEPAPSEQPAEKTESTYEIYKEDLSWTEAQARCVALGGHLAVISDEEEYNKIVELARNNGVPRLWIGLHRENGTNVWETDEDVSFYPWDVAAGEPSFSYDGVNEDYVMLWNNNGGWYYNDSCNDPATDYARWYSGTMGFICEYDASAE